MFRKKPETSARTLHEAAGQVMEDVFGVHKLPKQ
jgi:hypothetical protein